MNKDSMPLLLTAKEAGQLLRVCPTTIGRWAHQGLLPVVSFPLLKKGRRRYRIKAETISNILDGKA